MGELRGLLCVCVCGRKLVFFPLAGTALSVARFRGLRARLRRFSCPVPPLGALFHRPFRASFLVLARAQLAKAATRQACKSVRQFWSAAQRGHFDGRETARLTLWTTDT